MSQVKHCTISLEVGEADGRPSISELKVTFTGSSDIDLASFLTCLGGNLDTYLTTRQAEEEGSSPGDRLDAPAN